MRDEKFYLERVKHRQTSLSTVSLSSTGGRGDHIDCIKIHGTKHEATARAIKILGALNATD